MKNHILLLGALIASCGVFGHMQILQRGQALLSPEQMASLLAQNQSSWSQFFLPVAPVLAAYLLLPAFPEHQAFVAVPAIVLAAGVIAAQFINAAKRTGALHLPAAFMAARRKANRVLFGGVGLGMGLVLWQVSHEEVP